MKQKNILIKGQTKKVNRKKVAKLYTAFATAMLAISLGAVTVFAAPSVDVSKLGDGIEQALTMIISLIGGGYAVFGAISLIEGHGQQNAEGKAQGLRQMAMGLGMIGAGLILVPLFIGIINFGG